MRDPQPVELRRQPGQRQLEHPQPDPAGLEPPPRGGKSRERGNPDNERR